MAASMSAQRRYLGPFLGERAAAVLAAGLVDARAQAGVAAASRATRTGRCRRSRRRSCSRAPRRSRGRSSAAGRRGGRRRGARSSRSISAISLVELVDHAERGEHVAAPRLGELEAREQLAPCAPNRSETGQAAEREQLRVDAVLERAAVAHEVQPPAGPLALAAQLETRAARSPARARAARARRAPTRRSCRSCTPAARALDLRRVGDLDLPAAALERVVDEARAVHRLDRRADHDRPMVTLNTTRRACETRRHPGPPPPAQGARLPRPKDTSPAANGSNPCQRATLKTSLLPARSFGDTRSVPPRRPSFMTFSPAARRTCRRPSR